MPASGFWSRVREARLVRVLLVYLAAAWLVLQVTALLQDRLQLPDWVTPVIIVLLLAGLVVAATTAWLQSRLAPMRERHHGAGAVSLAGAFGSGRAAVAAPPAVARAPRHTVGREKERAELHAAFEQVITGRSLLVCVAGEPGIGKTTLVEEFVAAVLTAAQPPAIARGRCSERLAGTEAYLPFLEALESVLHGDSGESFARAMRAVAPAWYVEVSPRSPDEAFGGSPMVTVKATSQERMKRELSGFLEEVCRLRPLVLFFDDVHWADVSTVDLLAYLATQFDRMRILVVVTYRQTDLLLVRHPFLHLKLDLQSRGICREIELPFLTPEEIERYVALEFPDHRFPEAFPALIHAKTEGSPLFMVDVLRYLRDRNVIVKRDEQWTLGRSVLEIERDLPESVRAMIQKKIDQLDERDRRLLVAASVQGNEFDTATVASAVGLDSAEVEEELQVLDRGHAFVRLVGEEAFPERTLTLRYRFVHVLYQNALYASLTPTRRASLSAAIAHALLGFYGEQSPTVASELAILFEGARDASSAVKYFVLAAQNAALLSAYSEAILLARRGLELLNTLPDSPERGRQEIMLQITLGGVLIPAEGAGAPGVEEAYARARALSERVGDTPELFTALRGLSEFYHTRAELEMSLELAEHALGVAHRLGNRTLMVDAHHAVAMPLLYLGELPRSREHLAEGIALYEPEQMRGPSGPYHRALYHGIDPGVGCHFQSGRVLWLLGYPDQALEHVEAGITLAQTVSHPASLGWIQVSTAMVHQLRREPALARERAEAGFALAREHGLPEVSAWLTFWRGWAIAEQGQWEEGIAEMREGMAAYGAHEAIRPHQLALLAHALARSGEVEEGLRLLDEAVVAARTGGRYYEAELHRLNGELQLMRAAGRSGSPEAGTGTEMVDAEACFRRAIDVARHQCAKSLELRAAMSLAQLWQRHGKCAEARQILAETCGWFTEGFDTADLREAKALLEEFSSGTS